MAATLPVERHPDAWEWIQARHRFIADSLGIWVNPDVLSFSNNPAYLPSFRLRAGHATTTASPVPERTAASNRNAVETTRDEHRFERFTNSPNP